MSKTFQAAVGATILGSSLLMFVPQAAQASTTSPTDYAEVTAPVVQSMPATSEDVTYIVQSGDTLSDIGAKYCTSWQTIYADNESVVGSDPNLIQVGEKLVFPKGSCSPSSTNKVAVKTTSYYDAKGTPQQIAWSLLPEANRAEEFACLNNIIMGESSWDVTAENPSSGAYGIPQALPGNKMAGPWGQDWEGSAYVQLYWMIRSYIPQRYGTACDAWAFHLANGWY
jgi:LysM repeat protein